MQDPRETGIPGTATIAGHPIHPMLVPLPIGLLVGALLADIAYAATGEMFWASASLWLIIVGIAGALLAALAGLADFLGDRRIRALRHAWYHLLANLAAVLIAVVSLVHRWTAGVAEAVLPWGLVATAAVALLLAFAGWHGGEMVFRHGAGRAPHRGSP